MNQSFTYIHNQKGSVMVPALLMLALLTIIVFAAMNTSTTEQQVATNAVLYQRALYGAEAGLEHAIQLLEGPFVTANASRVLNAQPATWNFALNGSQAGINAATDTDADGQGDYPGGAEWIQNATIGGVNYMVTLWNNEEGGGAFNDDTDGRVWMQADAWDARGTQTSVMILLGGVTTGEAITGYTAQAGAGAGKNYNANDLNPITSFNKQM